VAHRLPPLLILRSDATFRTQQGQTPKDNSNAPPVTGGGQGGAEGARVNQPDPNAKQQQQMPCFEPSTMLLVALMFGVFYFLMIRPQQKQEKLRREMLSKADKGDKVVTSSGIHGVIVSGDKETVTVRVDTDVKLRFERSAIARVIKDEPAGKNDSAGTKDKKS